MPGTRGWEWNDCGVVQLNVRLHLDLPLLQSHPEHPTSLHVYIRSLPFFVHSKAKARVKVLVSERWLSRVREGNTRQVLRHAFLAPLSVLVTASMYSVDPGVGQKTTNIRARICRASATLLLMWATIGHQEPTEWTTHVPS